MKPILYAALLASLLSITGCASMRAPNMLDQYRADSQENLSRPDGSRYATRRAADGHENLPAPSRVSECVRVVL